MRATTTASRSSRRFSAASRRRENSVEQSLERLETIVEELEGGALSLEDSIARYEEGVKLSRQLGRTLDQAEKRIERLVANEDDPPTTEPLALDAADDSEVAAPAAVRRAEAVPSAKLPELPF